MQRRHDGEHCPKGPARHRSAGPRIDLLHLDHQGADHSGQGLRRRGCARAGRRCHGSGDSAHAQSDRPRLRHLRRAAGDPDGLLPPRRAPRAGEPGAGHPQIPPQPRHRNPRQGGHERQGRGLLRLAARRRRGRLRRRGRHHDRRRGLLLPRLEEAPRLRLHERAFGLRTPVGKLRAPDLGSGDPRRGGVRTGRFRAGRGPGTG